MDFNTFLAQLYLPATPVPLEPASLCQALAKLNDPRAKRGRRYRLNLLLTLVLLAKLAGHTTPTAVARFLRLRQDFLAPLLGLRRGRTPCLNTLRYACQKLDPLQLTELLAEFFQHLASPEPPGPKTCTEIELAQANSASPTRLRQLALDGKTLTGTFDRVQRQAVHLLELYDLQSGVVLAQQAVEKHKKNEITVAPSLLAALEVEGCLISADALHTQKKWCKHVKKKQAEWLLFAKANQKGLLADISFLFEGAWPDWLEKREAQSWSKGHGRLEQRHISVSSELKAYLSKQWVGVEQVFRLERTIIRQGQSRQEVVYGLTSLSPKQASADEILEYVRQHWGIENRLHWRKDVSLGEDGCQIKNPNEAMVWASLNNAVLSLMDRLGVKNVAAQLETYAANPLAAIKLLMGAEC